MALITTLIPEQNFEQVRDRIGAILALELPNQYTLGDDDANAPQKVWVERFIGFGKEELPAVNVCLEKGTFVSHTVKQTDGEYIFNIDCYQSSATIGEDSGDQLATIKLQKLLGLCRAILEQPEYGTLGFAAPSIMRREMETMQIAPQPTQEAINRVMGRLTFRVKVAESAVLKTGEAFAKQLTTITLGLTAKGYQYEKVQA